MYVSIQSTLVCMSTFLSFTLFPPLSSCMCVCLYVRVSLSHTHKLELCADVIVSAAARRSISGGGGAPPVQKNRRRRRRGRPKIFLSKIHEKISFYPQNFLRNFFSHQSFEVCR